MRTALAQDARRARSRVDKEIKVPRMNFRSNKKERERKREREREREKEREKMGEGAQMPALARRRGRNIIPI